MNTPMRGKQQAGRTQHARIENDGACRRLLHAVGEECPKGTLEDENERPGREQILHQLDNASPARRIAGTAALLPAALTGYSTA